MLIIIEWQKIEQKSKKSLEKLCKKYDIQKYEDLCRLSFDDLHHFFDENNVFIEISVWIDEYLDEKSYHVEIQKLISGAYQCVREFEEDNLYKAKESSIPDAFEIMEDAL